MSKPVISNGHISGISDHVTLRRLEGSADGWTSDPLPDKVPDRAIDVPILTKDKDNITQIPARDIPDCCVNFPECTHMFDWIMHVQTRIPSERLGEILAVGTLWCGSQEVQPMADELLTLRQSVARLEAEKQEARREAFAEGAIWWEWEEKHAEESLSIVKREAERRYPLEPTAAKQGDPSSANRAEGRQG